MKRQLNSLGIDKDPKETTVVSEAFFLNPIEFSSLFI